MREFENRVKRRIERIERPHRLKAKERKAVRVEQKEKAVEDAIIERQVELLEPGRGMFN